MLTVSAVSTPLFSVAPRASSFAVCGLPCLPFHLHILLHSNAFQSVLVFFLRSLPVHAAAHLA